MHRIILVGFFSVTPGDYVVDTTGGMIEDVTRLDFGVSTISMNIG